MRKFIDGVRQFQQEEFNKERELYERLAGEQKPEVLFITCSDSRIVVSSLMQSRPGELFILRNAGNIVPPYIPQQTGGEAATIEYAIGALNIKDVIVCGHSNCGAMKGLLHPELVEGLPIVASWLKFAEATRSIVAESGAEFKDDKESLAFAVEQNVLVQLQNLRTHPAIASRVGQGNIRLHGWVYHIGTGLVTAYNEESKTFEPLLDTPTAAEVIDDLADQRSEIAAAK